MEDFARNFHFDGQRTVGVELEFPLVGVEGRALDRPRRDALFAGLQTVCTLPGVTVSEEMGCNVLELGIGPRQGLFELDELIRMTLASIIPFCQQQGVQLLGCGVHPLTQPGRAQLNAKEKYQLYELESQHTVLPVTQGADIHLFTIAASCQVHVDVARDEAARVCNGLNALAGAQLGLTANSSVCGGSVDPDCRALRALFYDQAYAHEGHAHRYLYGIAPEFSSVTEYVDFLLHQPVTCLHRGGNSYLAVEKIAMGDFLDGCSCQVKTAAGTLCTLYPDTEDLYTFAGQAEYEARLSPGYGTVESRVSCQQPPNQAMVVPALVLGCVENHHEMSALVGLYPREYWRKLRLQAARSGLQDSAVIAACKQMLAVAERGLQARGLGEATFLLPLQQRLKQQQCPADIAAERFNQGGITAFLEAFSYRAKQ